MRRPGSTLKILAALALAGAGSVDTARAETSEVRLGIQFGLAYLPIVVADTEQLFTTKAKEMGLPELRVTLHRFSGSGPMNDAILSNSVDIGAYGPTGLLIAWDKTRGRQAVRGLSGLARTLNVLYTNRAERKALTDFDETDRIAVNAMNSPPAITLQMGVERVFGPGKWGELDKLMSVMPHPDATTAMLAAKTITAYMAPPPYLQILAKDPRMHAIVDSRAIFEGRPVTNLSLGATVGFADENPTAIRVTLAAMDEAVKQITANPRRAAEIYVQKEAPNMPVAEAEAAITDDSNGYDLTPAGTMIYAAFMQKTGMLRTLPASWKEVYFPFVHERPGS